MITMNSCVISFKEYNNQLIKNNELNLNYIAYVSRYNDYYNRDKYDLKTLDKISMFIEEDIWIPAYFIYEFEVLTSKYNHKDVRVLLVGENKSTTPNYIENIDYKELLDKSEIEKYNTFSSTRGDAPPGKTRDNNGRFQQSKLFIIEPYAFISILQRARNKYSRYLAFLVKCHVVYIEYQKMVSEVQSQIIIQEKDDKIAKLIEQYNRDTQKLIRDNAIITNAKINEVSDKLDSIQLDMTILSEHNIVHPPCNENEKYELIIYEAIDLLGHTQYQRDIGICICSDPIGYTPLNKSGTTIGPFVYVWRTIMNGNTNIAISSINFRINKHTPFIHFKDVANAKRLIKYIIDKESKINSWYSYFNIRYDEKYSPTTFIKRINDIYNKRLYIKDQPYDMIKEVTLRKTKK